MPGNSKNIFRLWEELKRRNVVRVAIVYLAAAYAILESSDIIFPRLGLPDWSVNLVMILLFIGLIIVIIFSWIYDITPEGVRITDVENGKVRNINVENLENKTIANYRITKKLGKDRLGIIYEAEDVALNRKVRLVFLAEWISADRVVRARLIEKAQAAAGIMQPGKTTIYSVEKDGDAIFIVMEHNTQLPISEKIPAELEEIIIEAIKDHSGEERAFSKEPSYIHDDDVSTGLPSELVELHNARELARRHLSIPRIVSSKKITFPAILVVILLIIVFNWSSINRVLGTDKSKREEALSHIYRGEEFFHLKDYNAAKEEFERATEIDPGSSVAWSNLAAVCINQNNLGEAIINTIKAIELDENNFKAAYNLAFALDDKNDYLQASEWYSRTIEMDSTFLPAYSALGRSLNLSGKPVDAILILKRALKKFPESDSIYLVDRNIGYSYFLIDRYNESIEHLNRAYNAKPREPETVLSLAQSYEAVKDKVMSIEFWKKYIELEPDSIKAAEAREHMEDLARQYFDDIIPK